MSTTRRRHVPVRLGYWAGLVVSVCSKTAAAGEIGTPDWVAEAGRMLSPTLGPWISQEPFLGVRWVTILVSTAVLAVILVVHCALRWIVQRKVRSDRAKMENAPSKERERYHWIGRVLYAAIQPGALLIWTYGVYAAISFVLDDLEDLNAAQTARGVLDFVASAGILAALFWLARRIGRVLERWLAALSQPAGSAWDHVLLPLAGKTMRLTLPLLVLILGIPTLGISPGMQSFAGNSVSLLVIGAVALILFQIVSAAEELILARYEVEVADRFQARRIRTQVTVLKKIVVVIIGVFTLASMLMVFDSVRQFGTSILASAGVAGIVIGFAAQRSISTLLAGVQIALTRPIRIDDVVIVENEWGRIEDITLTYVILCIWDQRRLILPITYFMERPFQNWTSTSSDILGTVFLHVDYTMPIQPLREELDRILQSSEFWDGKSRSILVTDAKEHTLEVRAMASAADGDKAWFLKCEIREKLIEFIRKHYPESLPRMRAEMRRSWRHPQTTSVKM